MLKKIRKNIMKKIVAGNIALQMFVVNNAYAALTWEDPLDTVVEALPARLRKAFR